MSWPKTADGQWYIFEGQVLMPVDPSTGAAQLLLRPQGVGVAVPAVEQGDPGVHAEIDEAINFTPLAPGDATPDSASWTTITPPTTSTPGVWKLNLALHTGQDGADGEVTSASVLAAASGSPTAGYLVAAKSDVSGVELVPQKIPEVFYPGSIDNVGTGNVNFTMTTIPIPSRPWARRVRPAGYTVVTGEAADVRVDLLARLNGTGGNIVGRCQGIAQTERLAFSPGKPIEAGTVADGYDTIAAGASATVYIRTERQAGGATYTAAASMSQFCVETVPA